MMVDRGFRIKSEARVWNRPRQRKHVRKGMHKIPTTFANITEEISQRANTKKGVDRLEKGMT